MADEIEGLKERAEALRRRIAEACASVGRNPAEVTLVWVSKTHPFAAVQAAFAAGAVHFGENRVQELVEKFSAERMAELAGLGGPAQSEADQSAAEKSPVRHLIGPLQSNKARKAIACADWIHTVASLELLERLESLRAEATLAARATGSALPPLEVLFQVNSSGEESKSGLALGQMEEFLAALPFCEHLHYRGLMTIGPFTGLAEDARAGFRAVRELRDRWRGRRSEAGLDPRFACFDQLSMGMTDDLEVAVTEGATLVRVGTALFGKREYGAAVAEGPLC
jgi:pyridoxal phosphate enzyme (YggS family)